MVSGAVIASSSLSVDSNDLIDGGLLSLPGAAYHLRMYHCTIRLKLIASDGTPRVPMTHFQYLQTDFVMVQASPRGITVAKSLNCTDHDTQRE